MLIKQRLTTSEIDLVDSKFIQFLDQLDALVFIQLLLFLSSIKAFKHVAELAFIVTVLFKMKIDS